MVLFAILRAPHDAAYCNAGPIHWRINVALEGDELRLDSYQVYLYPSGVGVTKPISFIPLFSELLNIVKTYISLWISRLYLTRVSAAELQWHLTNMNVIQRI